MADHLPCRPFCYITCPHSHLAFRNICYLFFFWLQFAFLHFKRWKEKKEQIWEINEGADLVCKCNNITTGKSQIEMSFCIHQKTLACVCVCVGSAWTWWVFSLCIRVLGVYVCTWSQAKGWRDSFYLLYKLFLTAKFFIP